MAAVAVIAYAVVVSSCDIRAVVIRVSITSGIKIIIKTVVAIVCVTCVIC